MNRNIKTLFVIGVTLLVLSMLSDKSDTGRGRSSVVLASDRLLEDLNTKRAMSECYTQWSGVGDNPCRGVNPFYNKGHDNGYSTAKSDDD
jgi:hypothetical protein